MSRSIPSSPVVDGDVLPRDPWRAPAAGAARDVELISELPLLGPPGIV